MGDLLNMIQLSYMIQSINQRRQSSVKTKDGMFDKCLHIYTIIIKMWVETE
jgi:hypothetical protein